MDKDDSTAPSLISGIQENLSELKILLEAILDRLGDQRRIDPQWLSIQDAARLGGMTIEAVQCRIRRENKRIGGFPIRKRHGAVHRKDWDEYLKRQAAKCKRTATVVEHALAGAEVSR